MEIKPDGYIEIRKPNGYYHIKIDNGKHEIIYSLTGKKWGTNYPDYNDEKYEKCKQGELEPFSQDKIEQEIKIINIKDCNCKDCKHWKSRNEKEDGKEIGSCYRIAENSNNGMTIEEACDWWMPEDFGCKFWEGK
jgi:hypothetical protein